MLVSLLVFVLSMVPADWGHALEVTCGNEPKACALFVAQAFAEGGWAPYVLAGRCNDPKWLDRQKGCHIKGGWCPCDGGNAIGPWQIHYQDDTINITRNKSQADWLSPEKGVQLAWECWRAHPGAWSTVKMRDSILAGWTAKESKKTKDENK